jgi:hypothetical protein
LTKGSSVVDPDTGSGAFLTPGHGCGIRNSFFRIPDLGSRIPDLGSLIPTPDFLELSDKFLDKKFFENWPKFFSSAFKK